ncbi:unnamed protein product [Arctogadus glacialis]
MVQSRDIFFALLLLGSTVSLEVQITPSQGEISVGESKFFLCDVVGTATKIEWFGPSGDRIEQNRPDITATTTDESSSTLTLYKAGPHHAGTYKCVARDGERQAEATVNVKIYQKITFTNAPSPQEFNEGDTAILVCDVISTPPPTVFWKHKGSRIQPEKDVRFKVLANNHLQIRGIKKTDEGSYTCEGRLMARGEIDMRFIQVLVNVLPTIRVWQTEVNSTADVGQTATLTCAVDGYPEPTVTWTRNGVVLDAEDKYSFNEDGSEMTIMEVAKLDEGEYTCIARNKAGESDQELSLRVFVKPRITYIVNQTTSEMEDQVTLTCEALGDPTPSINWSYGVQVFNEGEQAHLNRIYQEQLYLKHMDQHHHSGTVHQSVMKGGLGGAHLQLSPVVLPPGWCWAWGLGPKAGSARVQPPGLTLDSGHRPSTAPPGIAPASPRHRPGNAVSAGANH